MGIFDLTKKEKIQVIVQTICKRSNYQPNSSVALYLIIDLEKATKHLVDLLYTLTVLGERKEVKEV